MAVWIKDKSVGPREGWTYEVEGGGYVLAPSYSQLYLRIVERCKANDLPIPTREEIDQRLCETLTIECYDSAGGTRIDNKYGKAIEPHKSGDKNWPWYLLPTKLLAIDTDKGLGDIVERVIGPIGGNAFTWWHIKTFGKPCSKCGQRKEDWNRDYPL